jgi:hypothetical protein
VADVRDEWSDDGPVADSRARRAIGWTALAYAVAITTVLALCTYGLVRAVTGGLDVLHGVFGEQ